MVHEIGMEAIEARVLELAAMTGDILRTAGAGIVHERSNVVAARFDDRDASALARSLAERDIIVAARHGNLRVSPHFCNDESDLQAPARGLKQVR